MQKRILTGDRPTGPLHLGHYVGSLANRVRLQDEYDTYVLIADVQALTDNFKHPEKLEANIFEVALDYLAVGLDPEKVKFVVQSMVPELTELATYFMNLVTVATLERNPTVKEEIVQRNFDRDVPVGFWSYPISQAADIAIFKAHLVPVGEDQLPMIELTREIVRRFNKLYRKVLIEPKEMLGQMARLPGTDGAAKMSKSVGNCIYLGDTTEIVRKRVMSMFTDPTRIHPTDPGHLEGNPVFTYHDTFNPNKDEVEELKDRYRKGAVGDVEVKQKLFDALENFLAPIRERRNLFASQREAVREIIMEGTRKGRTVAQSTMEEVRDAMKLNYKFQVQVPDTTPAVAPPRFGMLDNFELVGNWWTLGTGQVPGRLTFSPTEGTRLELIGTLDPLRPGPVRLGDHPTIWGVTLNGIRISLFGCLEANSSLNLTGQKMSSYHASWMLIGEHVDSAKNADFREMEVGIFNLEEWVGLNGINYDCASKDPKDWALRYVPPAPVEFDLGPFHLSAECDGRWKFEALPPSAGIAQETRIKIQAATDQPFDSFIDGPLRVVRYLVDLACGSPVPLRFVTASSDRFLNVLPNGTKTPVAVSLVFLQRKSIPLPKRQHPSHMLFRLRDLRPDLQRRISAWNEGRDKFPAVLDLHFSINPEDSDIPLEFRFFSAFVACEAYHRATYDNEQLDPKEYKRRRDLLLSSVTPDPEIYQWAQEKILGNDLSARRRLERLYADQPEIVRRWAEPKEVFFRRALATRNRGIAHGHGTDPDVFSGRELYRAMLVLRLMIQTCLLRELGFAERDIENMIPRTTEYRILVSSQA